MEDPDIIALFFARDERALAETEYKYGKKLLQLSMNYTENRQDAEECVNDTYAAAWAQIPPTRPLQYYPFLCRIVRNLSITLFRKNTALKRQATTVSLDEELSEILPDTAEENDRSLSRALDVFLHGQKKDSRILFVRRYFYGDSLSSLASLAGMSEAALRMRLARLRQKCKEYLEKEGFPI